MEYLRSSSFLPESLVRIVGTAQRVSSEVFAVRISRAVAEEFRSAFTLQLAKVGFDANYELTTEGRLLEELIDRFFVYGGSGE